MQVHGRQRSWHDFRSGTVSLDMTPDQRLLTACAHGDETALNALHARHARAAFAFAHRLLNDVQEADEVVADAFLVLWQQASDFDARSQVRTWLLGIVRHKALDRLRRRNALPEVPLDDELADTFADDAPTPYDELARRQDAALVVRCLGELPLPQQEALHLALQEGLTLAQIAQLQQVPQNTVATRIHHAKRKLRDCVAHALGLVKNPPRPDDIVT